MKLQTAIRLIEKGIDRNNEAQVWADLGAGDGLFTTAIATLLDAKSIIYAVDTNGSRLNSIIVRQEVMLKKIQTDFSKMDWSLFFSGLLLANSIHFIKYKEILLQSLKGKLLPDGRIVIVEYDMEQPNIWVPYPVSFNNLETLAYQSGFGEVTKLEVVPSIYNKRSIYSALLLP